MPTVFFHGDAEALPEGLRTEDLLGNSGIKFEVEGGEGSPGADTYIPPPKKLQSFFIFHRKLRFCSIFLKFSKNAAFWENPEKIW